MGNHETCGCQMATRPPASEPRDVDAIRRDLSMAEGRDSAQRLSPTGRLVADVEPLLDRLAAVEALFAGGPDTACRTVWQDGIECVSVPLADLRAVLTGPTSR